MTTGLVVSVTDELVAELEALYLAGWEASGEGWNAEYPGDAHETKGFTDLMHKSCAPIIAKLLAERAELKRDAERYRLFAETVVADCNSLPMTTQQATLFGCMNEVTSVTMDELAAMFDAAMQSEAKP